MEPNGPPIMRDIADQLVKQGAEWVSDRLRVASDKEYFLQMDSNTAFLLGADPVLLQPVGSIGIYRLNLVNRIGRFRLGPLELEAESRKLSPSHFVELVDDVSSYVASLPFSYRGAGAGYRLFQSEAVPTKYHTFIHVRNLLRSNALQSAVARIVVDPHITFAKERIDSRVERARRVDATTVRFVAAAPRHFECTKPGSRVAMSPLGKRLAGSSLTRRFPGRVSATRMMSRVDNSENRFVLYALQWMLRETASLGSSARCPGDIATECGVVIGQLEQQLAHDLFREVSRADRLHLGSQVLQRRPGYREMLKFYSELMLPPAPEWAEDVRSILELKDAAKLYEYWVFITICRLVEETVGVGPTGVAGTGNDAADAFRDFEFVIKGGIRVSFPGDVRVDYNPHVAGYSGPFKPDIAVKTSRGMWVFDAKFRLSAESSDAISDDIHKMHTYRDALPRCRGAYVVYPGEQERLFPARFGEEYSETTFRPVPVDGVGAVPLRPGLDATALRRLLAVMVQ